MNKHTFTCFVHWDLRSAHYEVYGATAYDVDAEAFYAIDNNRDMFLFDLHGQIGHHKHLNSDMNIIFDIKYVRWPAPK